METFKKIKALLSEQLNIDESGITMESDIIKDLGADSIDVVEMLMGLEEEFSITVEEEEAVKLKTVGDIVKLIDSK